MKCEAGRTSVVTSFVNLLPAGVDAFQWTTSARNGSELSACDGDDFIFPWNYTLNSSDILQDVEWYSIQDSKISLELVISLEHEM